MAVPADLSYVESRTQEDLQNAEKLVDAAVQVLINDESYSPPPLRPSELADSEPRWERVPPLKFQKTGRLAVAYTDRERDNLMLLEEFGPPHWSTINYELEPVVMAAEASAAQVQIEIDELNARREGVQREVWKSITYLEERWRSQVREIVGKYVDKKVS